MTVAATALEESEGSTGEPVVVGSGDALIADGVAVGSGGASVDAEVG